MLREFPYSENAGQHSWIRSLLATTAAAGINNVVLVPSGAQLPAAVAVANWWGSVRSPHLAALGGRWWVAKPGLMVRRLAWKAYKAAPHGLQQRVADRRRARRRAIGRDHVLGKDWTPAEAAWLADQLRSLNPTHVMFDSVFATAPTAPGVRRVMICHDVITERAASLAAIGYRTIPAAVDGAWETERLSSANAIASIQWDDARAFRSMVPGIPVVVAPPTFVWTPSPRHRPDRPRCLVVGSGSLHNVDAVSWLLEAIWPVVFGARPDAELRVIGTVCGQVDNGTPGVDLRGEVDDLTQEYQSAALVLVPLRAGSGLKVKLVEALCHGKAAVSTRVGAQGLFGLEPQPFALADGANAFAATIIELLYDEGQRESLELAAQEASRAFDPTTAHQDLLALLGGTARE